MPGLFCRAGEGLMAALVDPASVHDGGIEERVAAEGGSLPELLEKWLMEVFYLFHVQQMVFARFRGASFSGDSVCAVGRGELLDPGRHVILRNPKGLALRVDVVPGRFEAHIVAKETLS